jgi:DNA invertase Pin-like site-specific DNA recombinase
MLIGYVRVSKADGSQTLDLQKDALLALGVEPSCIYEDYASGKNDDRPGLLSCLKALRPGDTLVVWKLDRLGRDLRNLIEIVHDLENRKIEFKVLTGQGTNIDTTSPNGMLVFSIFAALAAYEREMISERTKAGLSSARARGRVGGRKHKVTEAKISIAENSMKDEKTNVSALCKELGVARQTLYRYVSPKGQLRDDAHRLMAKKKSS